MNSIPATSRARARYRACRASTWADIPGEDSGHRGLTGLGFKLPIPGGPMLTLDGNQVEVLWDALLPEGVRMLPGDLAAIDELLSDPGMLAPFRARFEAEAARGRTDPVHHG